MKRVLATLVSLIWIGSVLFAGSFSIKPLRIDLSSDKKTDMLSVRNMSEHSMIIQLDLVSWDQKGGTDHYTPTHALIAVPSIFEIKPGASQTIRIGLRKMDRYEREAAYRLYLREVPSKMDLQSGRVNVVLRIGIPIFVKPRKKSGPILTWEATCSEQKTLVLRARNTGNAHIKVMEIAVDNLDAKKPIVRKMLSYILSGKERSWSFPTYKCPKLGTKLKLSVLTDIGRIHAKPVAK
ncbi:fimbrial biogenesis chaperone [Sulfurospirillum sp. 1612]|uniref:fimbrial biogenesis chaperone n=1 Tax=Sulfurospirillum sp. 1612 TaxID=3094835 RepID=UPI002F947D78